MAAMDVDMPNNTPASHSMDVDGRSELTGDLLDARRLIEKVEEYYQQYSGMREHTDMTDTQIVRLQAQELFALNAKQSELEALGATDTPFEGRDEAAVRRLEGENATLRQRWQTLLSERTDAAQSVVDVDAKLQNAWKQLQIKKQELVQDTDTAHTSTMGGLPTGSALLQLNQSTAQLGRCKPELLSLANAEQCGAVLERQMGVMETLTAEADSLRDRVSVLELQVDPLKQSVMELKEKANAAQEQVSQDQDRSEEEKHLEMQEQWYTEAVRVMQACSGVAVQSDDQAKTLTISVLEHKLCVQYNAAGTQFKSVKLSPASVDVSNIVDAAIRSQKLQFLIREVRGRLRNKPIRESIISDLTQRYVSSYDGRSSVIVTLDAGVACDLRIGPDYPAVASQISISKLEGVVGWSDDVLKRVGAEVNLRHCDLYRTGAAPTDLPLGGEITTLLTILEETLERYANEATCAVSQAAGHSAMVVAAGC